MKITPTGLPEVVLIEPTCFGDSRGFFFESYQTERYQQAGIKLPFVQDNISRSKKCVKRFAFPAAAYARQAGWSYPRRCI